MLVQSAFNITFLLFSYPAGLILEKKGYKYTLLLGLFTYSIGCFGICPAVMLGSYTVALLAVFILGIGFVLQMVAGNPFLAFLGPPQTASSRVTLGQAFTAVGQTLSPFIASTYILSVAADNPSSMGSRIIVVHVTFAITLVVLLAVVWQLRTPVTTAATEVRKYEDGLEPWHYKQLVFGVLGVFLYLGIEATSVGMFLNFIAEPRVANVPASRGGFYLTLYFVGFTSARFAGAAIQRKIRPNRLLMVHGLINIALISGVMLLHGMPVVWCLIFTAVFNSIMFPAMFSLGISGLGKLEARASGILFMALSGGAVVPLVQGAVADRWGTQLSFIVTMCCYAYILFFAAKGYKPGLFKVKSNSLAMNQPAL